MLISRIKYTLYVERVYLGIYAFIRSNIKSSINAAEPSTVICAAVKSKFPSLKQIQCLMYSASRRSESAYHESEVSTIAIYCYRFHFEMCVRTRLDVIQLCPVNWVLLQENVLRMHGYSQMESQSSKILGYAL